MINKIQKFLEDNYTLLIFVISFSSVLGSLYFSDVLLIEPCYLCWWQRIFMYPLFFLTTVSLVFKLRLQKLLVLSLSLPGLVFATYHYLMQTFGLFKEFAACTSTAKPCDVVDIAYLGFITIPFLSLCAFVAINLIVVLSVKRAKVKSLFKK